MISGVRNVSTLDRGRDKILGPEQQPGVESVAGGGAPEDLGLPLPTVRWAEMAHRPYGLAAVGPGCDTAGLPDEDRGRSRGCARPWQHGGPGLLPSHLPALTAGDPGRPPPPWHSGAPVARVRAPGSITTGPGAGSRTLRHDARGCSAGKERPRKRAPRRLISPLASARSCCTSHDQRGPTCVA